MLQSCIEDLYRYEGERCHLIWMQWRYILFTPAFRYTYLLRHAQETSNPFLRLFWAYRLRRCSKKFGFQIPHQTNIGRGFRLAHFGSVVVNPSTVIGDDCTLAQGCLLGNSQGKRKGCPIIGDRCQIGANAIVVGGVRIGDDVLVAPGAFINFDVPSNSIVIGNPGQIIHCDSSPTEKYIVYSIKNFR